MLRILTLAFAAVSVFAAEKPVTSNTVPAGAVIVSPGVFRFTDSAGKTWIYRKTPFGFVRAADTPVGEDNPTRKADMGNPFGETKANAVQRSAGAGSEITRVTEKGEELQFERKNPFGVSKWTRKKSELTPAEQEAWEKSRSAVGSK